MAIKKLLATTHESNFPAEVAVTLLRVYFGLALAIGHGLGKFPPGEQFIEGVGNLGFPMPHFFAWAASASEVIGGFLVAAGLFTRLGAFFIAGTMFVAGFLQHAADPFRIKELAFVYLCLALVFLARGAGRISLDYFLTKGKR